MRSERNHVKLRLQRSENSAFQSGMNHFHGSLRSVFAVGAAGEGNQRRLRIRCPRRITVAFFRCEAVFSKNGTHRFGCRGQFLCRQRADGDDHFAVPVAAAPHDCRIGRCFHRLFEFPAEFDHPARQLRQHRYQSGRRRFVQAVFFTRPGKCQCGTGRQPVPDTGKNGFDFAAAQFGSKNGFGLRRNHVVFFAPGQRTEPQRSPAAQIPYDFCRFDNRVRPVLMNVRAGMTARQPAQ